MATQIPSDASPEMRELLKAAEVGADAPERTSAEPGPHLSGGEQNSGPVRS